MSATSYHDLHITTDELPRTSVFNLPFNLMVTCSRTGGWELWRMGMALGEGKEALLAGEYDENGLRLDVAGHVIVDSLTKIPTT